MNNESFSDSDVNSSLQEGTKNTSLNVNKERLLIPASKGISKNLFHGFGTHRTAPTYYYIDDSTSESDCFISDCEGVSNDNNQFNLTRYNTYIYNILKRNSYRSWKPVSGDYPDQIFNLRQTTYSKYRNCVGCKGNLCDCFNVSKRPTVNNYSSTFYKKSGNKSNELHSFLKGIAETDINSINDTCNNNNNKRQSSSVDDECDELQSISLIGNPWFKNSNNLKHSVVAKDISRGKVMSPSTVVESSSSSLKRKRKSNDDLENHNKEDKTVTKRKKVDDQLKKKQALIDDMIKKSIGRKIGNKNDSDSSADVFTDRHSKHFNEKIKSVSVNNCTVSNEKIPDKQYRKNRKPSSVSEDEGISSEHRVDLSSNEHSGLGTQEIDFGDNFVSNRTNINAVRVRKDSLSESSDSDNRRLVIDKSRCKSKDFNVNKLSSSDTFPKCVGDGEGNKKSHRSKKTEQRRSVTSSGGSDNEKGVSGHDDRRNKDYEKRRLENFSAKEQNSLSSSSKGFLNERQEILSKDVNSRTKKSSISSSNSFNNESSGKKISQTLFSKRRRSSESSSTNFEEKESQEKLTNSNNKRRNSSQSSSDNSENESSKEKSRKSDTSKRDVLVSSNRNNGKSKNSDEVKHSAVSSSDGSENEESRTLSKRRKSSESFSVNTDVERNKHASEGPGNRRQRSSVSSLDSSDNETGRNSNHRERKSSTSSSESIEIDRNKNNSKISRKETEESSNILDNYVDELRKRKRNSSASSSSSAGRKKNDSKTSDGLTRRSGESFSKNSEVKKNDDKGKDSLGKKKVSLNSTVNNDINSTVLPERSVMGSMKDTTLLRTPAFMNTMKSKPTSTPVSTKYNDTISASSSDESNNSQREVSDDDGEKCDTDEENCVNERVDRYKSQVIPEAIKKIETKLYEGIRSEQFEEDLLFVEDFSDNDEIWVAQCPKSLKVESLLGSKFNLNGETTLSAATENGEDNVSYEAYSSSDQGDGKSRGVVNNVYCLIPSRKQRKMKLNALEIKGTIKIEERILLPTPNTIKFTSSTEVSLPASLKIRHPLLGSDFSEQLEALEYLNRSRRSTSSQGNVSVKKHVDTTCSQSDSSKKRKRKASQMLSFSDEADGTLMEGGADNEDDHCGSTLENSNKSPSSSCRKHKKKKRKERENDVRYNVTDLAVDEIPAEDVHRSSRNNDNKSSHHVEQHESEADMETETAIHKNVKKKSKKKKSEKDLEHVRYSDE